MMPLAIGLIALLAALEWTLRIDYSLGILYVIPVVIAASVLG